MAEAAVVASDSALKASLWLRSEGTPLIHYSCGPRSAVIELGQRYEAAKVAWFVLDDCCENHDGATACCFDQFDNDGEDCLLAYALARAEGRDIDPPFMCPRHGRLTFGGCCE